MRFKERGKKEITNQTVVGILRMMLCLIRVGRTANRFAEIMPMRDLHDKERQHGYE